MMNLVSVCCALVFVVMTMRSTGAGDDFYERLGVTRQASDKEIRKAFKKLALVLHPDKNRDDPNAQEKFLKINRAYEVLKDEDLRKKYDQFGEDGLKENGPSGGGYQSWNFYNQEFGIYDDDPEILTLSKSDFEISVDGTEDVWFINFYSAQCSHCHELAPTWREVARDLFGVIRIGAVNCMDNWHLCQQKGVQSYPTLILYPEKEKYTGDRNRRALVKFALGHVRAQVVELWSGNFQSQLFEDEEKIKLPWIITFCGAGGDCLERMTVTKLAAMLADLVNVGVLYCADNRDQCQSLGVEYGTYFYPAGKLDKSSASVGITADKSITLELSSMDASELAMIVLRMLPDVTELSADSFQKVLKSSSHSDGKPWLIHFTDADNHDLELRKLPALLANLNVGRVDCRNMRTECNNLHVNRFPTFIVFKTGGGHEIHYGRQAAHDIAAFARDSAQTGVRALGPSDFPRVISDKRSWFIDFFAPWCPPCMRLLPEFRKASKEVINVISFGTVDCTVHVNLCQMYNVHSYPTTILYNDSVAHQYHGHHGAAEIVDFIQDIRQPSVLVLDPRSFDTLIGHKRSEEMWLVDFYAPWCGPCMQLLPEWRKLAKIVKDVPGVRVSSVDCQAYRSLCQDNRVESYPTIRLYPPGTTDSKVWHAFSGWFRDAPSIRAWAFEFLPSKVIAIDRAQFHDSVLPSKEPWIIDFFAPWCGHCQVFAPEFERVAMTFEGRVKAAKVNCDQNQYLCQEAGIGAYPTVRFYPGSRVAGGKQGIHGEDLNSQDANYITSVLNGKLGSAAKKSKRKDEL